jgi:hypothetical protein
MLPTFPALNDDFDAAVNLYLRMATRRYGIAIPKIGKSRISEGTKNVIVRPSGKAEKTKMVEAKVELKISGDDMRSLILPDLLGRLDAIAKDMAGQQEKHLFERLSELLKDTPNNLDARGEKFSPELFYKAINAIEIDFNPDGSANMPSIYIPPSMAEDVKAAVAQAENDQSFKERFDKLLLEKKEKWRAREADRQLVG